MSQRDLARLSEMLQDVHQAAQGADFEEFPHRVLRTLQRGLKVDKAWWGVNADRNIHTSVSLNLPADHLALWQRTKEWDPIAEAAIAQPGVTAMFNADRLRATPRKARWLKQFSIAHVLSTTWPHSALNITSFLSVYRTYQPFTEADRHFKQLLMPHLALAQASNWARHLQSRAALSGDREPSALAIVDASGLMHCADLQTAALLREEWPAWQGPRLAAPLLPLLQAPHRPWTGRRIQAQARPEPPQRGLWLVRLTRISRGSLLSPQELAVASTYARGLHHKQVAQVHGLAPATVRHYLRNVYTKLDISNKAALARLAAQEQWKA